MSSIKLTPSDVFDAAWKKIGRSNHGKAKQNSIKAGGALIVAGIVAGLLAAFVPHGAWQSMSHTLSQYVWTPVTGHPYAAAGIGAALVMGSGIVYGGTKAYDHYQPDPHHKSGGKREKRTNKKAAADLP